LVPLEERAAQRSRMLAEQDKVASEMRISPDGLARINGALAATN
jgi:hypothetical protein